ncbi:hypothetical protein B0H34DRAFT_663981 [Crassisporium funariophilum]|nr:hypothetical protein B0H34DRAFT_663981 [Crassisporium funariophilum]
MPPRSAGSAWSDPDINALINYLVSQLPTVADGTGFKPTVWNEAAVVVNALNKGRAGEKTSSSCKSKFARLKETYNVIVKIKSQSGFKWDDENGADIDKSTAEVWAAFEKKHKGSTPFRNKGWIWFNKVQPLMPTTPRGANVYRASQAVQPESQETLPEPVEVNSQDSERPFSNWVCFLCLNCFSLIYVPFTVSLASSRRLPTLF